MQSSPTHWWDDLPPGEKLSEIGVALKAWVLACERRDELNSAFTFRIQKNSFLQRDMGVNPASLQEAVDRHHEELERANAAVDRAYYEWVKLKPYVSEATKERLRVKLDRNDEA